jgi:hypothetical protein
VPNGKKLDASPKWTQTLAVGMWLGASNSAAAVHQDLVQGLAAGKLLAASSSDVAAARHNFL